jgi:hypothetical protein
MREREEKGNEYGGMRKMTMMSGLIQNKKFNESHKNN